MTLSYLYQLQAQAATIIPEPIPSHQTHRYQSRARLNSCGTKRVPSPALSKEEGVRGKSIKIAILVDCATIKAIQ